MRPLSIAALLFGLGCSVPEPASTDPRQFFTGKTMTYIVATEAGGGYDTYGRLVAEYLGKHLGLGRVIVKNVASGGHIVGTNEIYSSPPDGLTLGIFNTGIIYTQLLKGAGLRADLTQMSWIGKAGGEPRVLMVSSKTSFRSLEDVRASTRPLLLGVNGMGTEGYYDSVLLAYALGIRTKPVLGMAGRDAQFSMMRGDIDGHFASASTARPFVDNGYGRAIVRVGEGAGLDDRILDAAGFVTSPEGTTLVDLVRSIAVLSRWTAGPPDIPEDRLAIVREAYIAALRDPRLLDAARKLDIPIVPMDGATLTREVAGALSQSTATVALIRSIVDGERTIPESSLAQGTSARR